MKKLIDIRRAPDRHWVGDGFPVRTMFSYNDGDRVSPFLLLDHAGPAEFPPADQPRGVGEHPHRGFETVTIVYQGELEHRDSAGHRGTIGPGDVQWMTAASGVVHEEWHERAFTRRGGTMEMAQLWVNLPARDKMSRPAYQEIHRQDIPAVEFQGGGAARIIAGELQGRKGPAHTFTPLNVWDVHLKAGQSVELEIPDGFNALVAVLKGNVVMNGADAAESGDLAIFERSGQGIAMAATQDATVLLLSGQPIDEPIVGYGPFVMNTEKEIRQAIHDYQSGLMGHLTSAED